LSRTKALVVLLCENRGEDLRCGNCLEDKEGTAVAAEIIKEIIIPVGPGSVTWFLRETGQAQTPLP
jgi:hypothetical protein